MHLSTKSEWLSLVIKSISDVFWDREKRIGTESQAGGRRNEVDTDSIRKMCSSFFGDASKIFLPHEIEISRLFKIAIDATE